MEFLDLRWLTGICQIVTGLVAALIVIHVWWLAPNERAERFGPYFTGEGLRALLMNLPSGLLFGIFLVLSGMAKIAFYATSNNERSQAIYALSTGEAIFGVIVAAILVFKGIRAV